MEFNKFCWTGAEEQADKQSSTLKKNNIIRILQKYYHGDLTFCNETSPFNFDKDRKTEYNHLRVCH